VPLENGVVPDATDYRNKAAEMRRFAQEAGDAARRRQFLEVARQYDKLARRAEERSAHAPTTAASDRSPPEFDGRDAPTQTR
jgi:hypothetical protein